MKVNFIPFTIWSPKIIQVTFSINLEKTRVDDKRFFSEINKPKIITEENCLCFLRNKVDVVDLNCICQINQWSDN